MYINILIDIYKNTQIYKNISIKIEYTYILINI